MENPQEYEDLLTGLRDQYQPVGRAEEMEVERITQCWWRLKRASRHENAVNLVARRDLANREVFAALEGHNKRTKEEAAIILQLEVARKEIEDTREMSQELKQRIVALMPGMETILRIGEEVAQELIKEVGLPKWADKFRPRVRSRVKSWILAMDTVSNAIVFIEQLGQRRWTNTLETAIGQHAIPNREALDRLLRYETTIDRSLTRAIDRLERLQRRRGSERIRQETDRIQ